MLDYAAAFEVHSASHSAVESSAMAAVESDSYIAAKYLSGYGTVRLTPALLVLGLTPTVCRSCGKSPW